MRDINLKEENSTSFKDHEEILAILEELKQFEQRYPAFQIEEPILNEELIEVEPKPEKFVPFKEPGAPATPTVFRIRFTEDGKLENIDLKKPKPKKEFRFSLKKIKSKKRVDKKESKSNAEKSKISKLKDGLKKIGKLKKVIPSRNKQEEEPEESEE